MEDKITFLEQDNNFLKNKDIDLAEKLFIEWREKEKLDGEVYCETCANRDLTKHKFTGVRKDYCTMVPMKDFSPNKTTINKATGEQVVVSVHRAYFCYKNSRHKKIISLLAKDYKPLDFKNIKRPQTTQEKFLSEGYKQIHPDVFIKKLDNNKFICRLFCDRCGEFVSEETRTLDKDTDIEIYCSSCESRNNYHIKKEV